MRYGMYGIRCSAMGIGKKGTSHTINPKVFALLILTLNMDWANFGSYNEIRMPESLSAQSEIDV